MSLWDDAGKEWKLCIITSIIMIMIMTMIITIITTMITIITIMYTTMIITTASLLPAHPAAAAASTALRKS